MHLAKVFGTLIILMVIGLIFFLLQLLSPINKDPVYFIESKASYIDQLTRKFTHDDKLFCLLLQYSKVVNNLCEPLSNAIPPEISITLVKLKSKLLQWSMDLPPLTDNRTELSPLTREEKTHHTNTTPFIQIDQQSLDSQSRSNFIKKIYKNKLKSKKNKDKHLKH